MKNHNFSIFLRPFQEEDAILINKWRNDPEIHKFTGGPINYVSLEIERAWVRQKMMENRNELYLAICLNDESKKMIGYISLNKIDHVNKCLDAGGCVIGDKESRDGVSLFESIFLILDYAFNQLNMHRVTASCLPEHWMAPYHLGVFGFKKEGTLKECRYKNGKYHDMDLYALMRKDFDSMLEKGEYEIRDLIRRFRKIVKEAKR